MVLIYTSAMGAIIIPLRAFESKEQAEGFIQMAKSYHSAARAVVPVER
ncbi:MAG: YcxB family protein [Bacillota bacterium]